MLSGLGLILVLVFVLPFAFKRVEHNLEVFLFVMGVAAAVISRTLNVELAVKALREPVLISGAVLASGLLFQLFHRSIRAGIRALLKVMSVAAFAFLLVVILGLASSFITAIIASLVLVEVVDVLQLKRKAEVSLVVVACFAIGLGAALTPVGEPLATIAVSKLGQDFWYLLRLVGPYVVPGIVALGAFAAYYLRGEHEIPRRRRRRQDQGPATAAEPTRGGAAAGGAAAGGAVAGGAAASRAAEVAAERDTGLHEPRRKETYRDVVVRALKVYLFVMALVLLGDGFRPVIDRFVIGLPSAALYWINMVSAILDNATLTAAEVSLKMSSLQLKSVLMGLLISGGMLIPGNIPNIISAGKLKVGSREWARLGVPLGIVLMGVYFAILFA